MAKGKNMSELDFFFDEQQQIMNMPDEDLTDYLMRRQRSTASGSYSFDTHLIGGDAHIETHSPVDSDISIGRITSASPRSVSAVTSKNALGSSSGQHPGTRNQREPSPPKGLPVDCPAALPVTKSSLASKRPSEERMLDPRMLKKPRNEAVSSTAADGISSRALGTPRTPEHTSSSELASSSSPRRSPVPVSSAKSPVTWAPGLITDNRRSSLVSADLPTYIDVQEDSSRPCHNSNARENLSSEPQHVSQTAGPPKPHQANAAHCEAEQTVSIQKPADVIPPPPAFNRRSTFADCSDVTSPPNSAPAAATPSTLPEKGTGSVNAPRRAKNATKREPTKTVKVKGRKNAKELITPLEYARKLQAQFSEQAAGKKPQADKPFLQGKRIFYYGGDLNYAGPQTRNRMEIITRHGGILVPKYDPTEITHIVTDASESAFLRAVGLKKLDDIPQHIPTVKWSWVLSGFDRTPIRRLADGSAKGKAPEKSTGQDPGKDVSEKDAGELEYPMDHEFLHASYRSRIDAGRTPWGEAARLKAERAAQNRPSSSKVQPRVGEARDAGPAEQSRSADDISNISDFTQDVEPGHGAATILPREGLPSPPSSPGMQPRAGRPARQEPDSRIPGRDAHVSRPSSRDPSTKAHASGSGEPPGGSPPMAADPLAEFYATARAEQKAEMFQDGGSEGRAQAGKASTRVRREVVKKGFICDDKGGQRLLEANPNQDVIDKLQELKALHQVKPSKDDEWRVYSYNKAISALRKYPTRIESYEEALAIRGIGEKTARKIMEIIETGGLRRIEHERTEDVAAVQAFLGVYGVGPSTAFKWYNSGCRTLEDLAARKGGIKLTAEQEIGLRYYKDINTRIPRAEVAEIYAKVKAAALKIDSKLFIEVMGSYRRGKADCGDIDVLITRPTDDGKTHQGVLRRLLAELHRQGIITDDLCLPDDFDDLELVYRGLCRKDSHSLRRRIDFLTVPWTSRGAALLYYTGDDIFNRSLRLKANKMGYSLNQRGLYAGVIRNPSDKRQRLHDGHIVASETEKEIFDILGVPWQEPHERVRG